MEFPRLDIAVTTPGLNIRKTIFDYTEDDLDRVINLNVKGTVCFFQAFGRHGRQNRRQPDRLLIGAAGTVEPGLAVYGSTKAAISLLVKGFASEVGRSGVRVNAIAPSIAETALTAPFKQRPALYDLYAAHTVFNRWSKSDEVAAAVAFLASDAASYVSGSTLFVDGGWTGDRRAADRPDAILNSGTKRGYFPALRKPARSRSSRWSAPVNKSIRLRACRAAAAFEPPLPYTWSTVRIPAAAIPTASRLGC